jgi:hypothetical protein
VNDEMKTMWREALLACTKEVLESNKSPEMSDENQETPQSAATSSDRA